MRLISKLEYRKLLLSLHVQYDLPSSRARDLFPMNELFVKTSRATKRIKGVYHNNELLFSFRPLDGWFTPSLKSAEKILLALENNANQVVAVSDAEPFIREGKSLFSKHVIQADTRILPKQEVFVVNKEKELLGIGVAILPGVLMIEMDVGVAVKVRHGNKKELAS